MFIYAIDVFPLTKSLRVPDKWLQLWYADDASAGGTLSALLEWFTLLCSKGPSFCYVPQPSKCFLVVTDSQLDEAKHIFNGVGAQVVTGHRYMGGFIDDCVLGQEFVLDCVNQWCNHVKTLFAIPISQPQAAFAATTKSLQFEWTLIMRVIRNCGPLFSDLEKSIFLPALFGVEVSLTEWQLFSLLLREGSLDIFNPTTVSDYCFVSSLQSTIFLRSSIRGECSIRVSQS